MKNMIELRDVLIDADNYSWDDSVFLPDDKNWTLNSKCAVLNLDDLDEDDETPEFATKNHLIYGLGIQQIQDVVENVKKQKPQYDVSDLFDAFIYYYQNDSFSPTPGLSKERLVELVKKIIDVEGTEEEIDEMISLLKKNVPHPSVTDLIYYPKEEMTPDKIVDEALSYKPIQL